MRSINWGRTNYFYQRDGFSKSTNFSKAINVLVWRSLIDDKCSQNAYKNTYRIDSRVDWNATDETDFAYWMKWNKIEDGLIVFICSLQETGLFDRYNFIIIYNNANIFDLIRKGFGLQ